MTQELKKAIRGAGGGGGGKGGGQGHTPVEAPDTLRSRAYARVLDLVCEGEIEGLAEGMQSIYLNETPLQNPNGTFNFSGTTVEFVNGTQGQSSIPGFAAVENENFVNVQVEQATPIVRTINDEDVDFVRVRLSVPQLTKLEDNGDLNGASVTYRIEIQSDGGGYVPQVLGANWRSNTASISSGTLAQSTLNGYQMSIRVTDQSAAFTVQYRKQGTSTWLSDGITRADNTFSFGKFNIDLGDALMGDIYTMPVQSEFAKYEMRIVVSSGTATIREGSTNIGSPNGVISGKTTSKYERTHLIRLTGGSPYDIRVRRITADSTSVRLVNGINFESYTEIISSKLRYPNSALVGIRLDAEQFQNVPKRSYDLKMLRVQVPSNYDAETRTYTGVWDGTFQTAWTDNPAWCFYDLLTNSRYGLGEYIDATQVDKWTLFAIAQYCDELVPDGLGGTEPRFTCNMYLQTRNEAYNVVNAMASIFRGMPYWATGSITMGYDAPADPVYQFTNANVVDGMFNYSGSGAKARHTVALVTWNDPDDFYRQKVEYVEDAEGIVRYGVVQREVAAIGCTSRGQANRVGRWILNTEQTETEMITFKTGLEGYPLRPSAIIQVADEMRAGTRLGGRITASTSNSATIDKDLSEVAGIVDGTISVVLPDGSLESKDIQSVVGNTVNIVGTWSSNPAANAVFMVQTSTISAQLYRVISIVEAKDGIEVTALQHNPNKYAEVEQGLNLPERQISQLTAVPGSPQNLSLAESLYEIGTQVEVQVTLSWDSVPQANGYIVTYKVGDRNFVTLPQTNSTSVEIRQAIEGQYTFRVQAINSLGRRSTASELSEEVYGKTLPPADVENFSVNVVGSEAHLTWQAVPDLDLSYYKIRYNRATTGATYENSTDALPRVPRPATTATLPARTGTYFIKAVDKSGFQSENAAEIVTIIDSISGLNVVETSTQHPAFTGAKTDVVAVDDLLILDTSTDFDDGEGDFDDAVGLFDGGGGFVSGEGIYDFDNVVDLGLVYTSRVTAKVDQTRVDYVGLFDDTSGLFDSQQGQFDGASDAKDDVNVELYVSTTNDDPTGTPTWSEYRLFQVGDYTARALRFRARLVSTNTQSTPSVSFLQVTVDMPDRVLADSDIESGAGAKVVSFSPAFKATPSIGIAAQNLQQGDYYTITSKSASSFTITFYNGSDVAVDRTFDYVARGYGEQAA